ncbi:MAG: hypothetical protein SXU28_10915 [Pseudomonadota bacterium]|nr:hypothetical protein [Pseudomonadota bacterium]
MKNMGFIGWCLVCVGLFAAAGWYGYSPFGDGARAAGVYSRGGGPVHK